MVRYSAPPFLSGGEGDQRCGEKFPASHETTVFQLLGSHKGRMTNKMRVFNGQIAQNGLSTADPRVSQNPHVVFLPLAVDQKP